MEFITKKTTELNQSEKEMMLSLFNITMKRERTLQEFDNQFCKNPLGYSYHTMMLDNDQVVGNDAFIPSYYLVNGERMLFVNAVDTIVSKPYRDFLSFYEMVTSAYDYLRKEGVVFVYSFPNENSYLVELKAKLAYDIGRLSVYGLPFRIGGIRSSLKGLTFLTMGMAMIYAWLSSVFSSSKTSPFQIEKESVTYNATRYERLDKKYQIVQDEQCRFVYKIMIHEGIRTAFIVDVNPKTAKNFNKAVRYLLKHESSNFDLILYVGNYTGCCSGLIKIPPRFSTKNFYFTGFILDETKINQEDIFNLNHWDVNLSNYDLL